MERIDAHVEVSEGGDPIGKVDFPPVEVAVYRSPNDGTIVVDVDTEDEVRVLLNDTVLHDDEPRPSEPTLILADNIIRRARALATLKVEDFSGLNLVELDYQIEDVATALARRGVIPNEGLFDPREEHE